MKRLPRDQATGYEIAKKDPLLRVKLGEAFVIETEDADNGCIQTNDDQAPATAHFNPVTGPIYVEGVARGDVLVVNIKEVLPDRDGHTLLLESGHPLEDSARWPECRGPYTHMIKHVPGPSGTTSDGRAIFNEKMSWELHPFIGTIGVAPDNAIESGSDSCIGQGPWGGNLDSRDICKGSKVLLPVYHEGGLLYVGDAHGSMADTEFTGVADETRAEVVLTCDVIKRKSIPFVRIETADSIIQLNSHRPLEDAITQAILWLMEWLVTDYGMKPRDAYLNMSVNPYVKVNVYQMVKLSRLEYTVGVQFPKAHLPNQ